MQYTDKEGWTLRAFATGYLDWGVELINPEGKSVYYSPCGLSSETYGFSDAECPHCDGEGVVVDEEISGDDGGGVCEHCQGSGQADERRSWTEDEWGECLRSEMDTFIEAYGEE